MEGQSAEASELRDAGTLEDSEDMVDPVKGSGRPDLDENEEDDSTDVAEQASLLSDFEDEDYVSEVVVGSLPLVLSEGQECAPNDESPRQEGSQLNDRLVEVPVSTEAAMSLELNFHGDVASTNASSTLVGDRNLSLWQASSETNFLDDIDEDVLFGPSRVATVQVDRSSIKFVEVALAEGPISSVHSVPENFVPTASPRTRSVGLNIQPVQTLPRTVLSSESGEDDISPVSDAKIHLVQTSGVTVDALGTPVSVIEAGERMPRAAPSPKLDHVSDVMLRCGSSSTRGFGADGLKVDGKDCVSPARLDVKDTLRKKGTIMRLGSKEAEELLQLDLTKMGRAILPSVKKGVARAKSPIANGVGWGVEDLGPDELSRYVETLEVKETYLDTVLDMEDVLLDSDDNHRPHGFLPPKNIFNKQVHRFERDGSVTASISGVPWMTSSRNSQPFANRLVEVGWAEVVGARQRRGGASLSERVVGVQEHTVYRILVRGTGDQEWEVERRYRDFFFLYQQLNRTFPAERSVNLPAPWDRVRAESRKFFGNTSPNVVEVRSALITVCLQSLLQAGPPLSTASPFLRFLFPTTWSATQNTVLPRAPSEDMRETRDEFESEPTFSPRSDTGADGNIDTNSGTQSVFGKTIRLRFEVHKSKPLAQQMQSQHHACAGCYRPLAFSVGLIPGLVQSFGFSGPRWCEYSGQLYCSSCHLNETAVIPAYVVQHWDFELRPVSQLAKAYLDSIYDKPMLCVSAVNPYLYFRVPILVHLRETRKRLSKMLACIRCPSRSRIQGMVGSRRYLLESNDFYALRDLNDLSKGAFAGLPYFVNTLSEKLTVHIKRECSICHEMGELCGAGNFCRDPLDIIFPFQDDGVVRCVICQLSFHKPCFKLIKICPSCSGGSSLDKAQMSATDEAISTSSANIVGSSSTSSSGTPLASNGAFQADATRQSKIKMPGFLSGILTPKDSSSRETIPGRQDSVVLDMISGPLDL